MLSTLIGVIRGSVLTVLVNTALLFAAVSLSRLLFAGESLVVKWVAAGISASWLMTVISIGLLFSGAFSPVGIICVSILLAALGKRMYGKRKESSPINEPGFLPRPNAWEGSTTAISIVGFALLFQFCRGILMPPLAWDSLTFHMPLAGLWVQNGCYVDLPGIDACEFYSRYPHNGELIFSWLMLPFGSDLLANLGNFPFLLLAAGATYGIGEELNIGDKRSRILATSLLILSPPLFAYVTTQYVDIQIFAENMAGVLFLLRFFRTGNRRDAVVAFAGFGLAAATKVISLQLFVICIALFVTALLFRQGDWKRKVGTLCLVFVVSGLVACPWYLRNWLQTGSPLYPFPLAVFGKMIFHGSAAMQTTLADKAARLSLTTKNEIAYWVHLCTFASFPILNWGPTLVFAALSGLAGMIMGGATSKSTRRWQWLALSFLTLTEFLQFVSDGMTVARLGWPSTSARYMAMPVALLILASLSVAGKAKYLNRVIMPCMLGLLLMDFQAMNSYQGAGAACKWVHYGSMLAACAFVVGVELLWRSGSLQNRRLIICISFISAVPLLTFLQQFRDNTRIEQFERVTGLHSLGQMQDLAPGWRYLDGIKRPLTIAVTAGWGQGGHNWFLYPLMGRRLQNRIVYVAMGDVPSHAHLAGNSHNVSVAEWIEKLAGDKVDFLFVIMPPPPELELITRNPSYFEAVDGGKRYRIYRYRQTQSRETAAGVQTQSEESP